VARLDNWASLVVVLAAVALNEGAVDSIQVRIATCLRLAQSMVTAHRPQPCCIYYAWAVLLQNGIASSISGQWLKNAPLSYARWVCLGILGARPRMQDFPQHWHSWVAASQ
jgi:hypothetical protein